MAALSCSARTKLTKLRITIGQPHTYPSAATRLPLNTQLKNQVQQEDSYTSDVLQQTEHSISHNKA